MAGLVETAGRAEANIGPQGNSRVEVVSRAAADGRAAAMGCAPANEWAAASGRVETVG
jgi:hypothetical protein